MNLKIYFLLFIFYSFLGWLLEVIDCRFTIKKWVNRGFLIGPLCPIYGVGCLLIILLLNRYLKDPLVLFVLAIIICSLLEYLTSYILEKIFHVRWWDYSHKKYNINGRICLETMLPFGCLGFLIIYILNPFVLKILNIFNPQILNWLFYIIFLLFISDLVVSLKIIRDIKIITSNIAKDNTEEINAKVREKILSKLKSFKKKESKHNKIKNMLFEKSYFTKRFINAYPKFKIINKLKEIKIEKENK